uniref:Kelch domain containing 7B n=1 Tax=Vombatus ursinus TaxID=29139 RepID=A0A4X2K5B7_VOMUR
MALSFSEADGDGEDSVALTLAQAMLALAVVAATALALHWLGSGSEQGRDVAKQSPESSQTQHSQDREMVQTPTPKAKVSRQDQETKALNVMPYPPGPSPRKQPGRGPEAESPGGKDEGLAPPARAPKITSRIAPPKQTGGGSRPSCGPQSKAGSSPGPLLIHFTPRHPDTWNEGGFGVREQPSLLVAAPAGEKPGNGQGPVGQQHDAVPSPRTRSRVRGPGPDPFTLGTVVSVWDAIDVGSSLAPGDSLRGGLLPQTLGTRVSDPAETPTGPAPEEKGALPPGSFQDTAPKRGRGEGRVSQGQSKPLASGPQAAPPAVHEGIDSKSVGPEPSPRGTGPPASRAPSPAVQTPVQVQTVAPDTEEGWPWKERELLITSSFSQPPNAPIRQLVGSGQGSALPIRKETTEAVPAPRQVSTDPSLVGTSLGQDPQVPSTSPGSVPVGPAKPGSRVRNGRENNLIGTRGETVDAQAQVNSTVIHEGPGLSLSSSSGPSPTARRTMESPSSEPPPIGSQSVGPSHKAARSTEFPSLASAPTGSPSSVPAPTGSLTSAPAPTGSLTSAPIPKGSLSSAPAPKRSPASTPTPKGSLSSAPAPKGSPASAPTPKGSLSSAPAPKGSPASAPTPKGSLSSAPAPTGSSTSAPAPKGSLSSAPVPKRSPASTPASTGSSTSAPAPKGSISPAPVPQGSTSSAPAPKVSSSAAPVCQGSSSSASAPPGSLTSAPALKGFPTSVPAPSGSSTSVPESSGSSTSASIPSGPPSSALAPSGSSTSAPVSSASLTSAPVPSGSLTSVPTLSGPPTSAPTSTVSVSSDHIPTGASPSAPLPTTFLSSGPVPPESLSSAVPPRALTPTVSPSSGPSSSPPSIPSSTGPPSSVHTPSTLSSSVSALSVSPSEPLPSAPIATASLPKDLPSPALASPVKSAQRPSKAEGLTASPALDPAPGGQSVRALPQGPSGNWGNLISMVLRSHPFPCPEKLQGAGFQSIPAECLGPAAVPSRSSKTGELTPGANTVVMEPQAKVRDQSPSEGLETPGTTTPSNSRGLNGAQVEEKRMVTTDPQSVAQGPSPPSEPLGYPRLAPERKQPEPLAPKEAMPEGQPAPRPRKRSISQMVDSLPQKVSPATPAQREAPAGLVAPLTERQLQDSQLMAFLRRPGTWGMVEGQRKPSHAPKDLPSTAAAMRRPLDLGSCVEALAFAQQHGELALAEEVYALMSDNFLLVLGEAPLYRQLSAGDRERILALRTTRGQAVLGVLVLPSAYGVSRSGLAGGSQAAEMPTVPSVAVPRTYLHVFEPGRNTWLPLTLVPEEAPLRGCGLCTMHNYLFLAGGIRGSGPGAVCTNEVFCYNPLTDIWTQVRPMLQARAQLKLVALEGLLYAIGGECLYSMECYDPRTDHWTSRAPLPAGTFPVAHEAVACRGDIYVTGGHLFYRLLKYSPTQDCWAECPYSASHRRSSDMVALGGFLYRFDLLRGVGAAVMRYNTVTGSWSQAAPLPLPEPIPLRCAVLGNTIYCLNQQVTATFTVAEGTARFEVRELKPFPMGGKGILCPFTLTLPALTPLQTPL